MKHIMYVRRDQTTTRTKRNNKTKKERKNYFSKRQNVEPRGGGEPLEPFMKIDFPLDRVGSIFLVDAPELEK